jgi:hypothetical protein
MRGSRISNPRRIARCSTDVPLTDVCSGGNRMIPATSCGKQPAWWTFPESDLSLQSEYQQVADSIGGREDSCAPVCRPREKCFGGLLSGMPSKGNAYGCDLSPLISEPASCSSFASSPWQECAFLVSHWAGRHVSVSYPPPLSPPQRTASPDRLSYLIALRVQKRPSKVLSPLCPRVIPFRVTGAIT